jgi:hypothetical protein
VVHRFALPVFRSVGHLEIRKERSVPARSPLIYRRIPTGRVWQQQTPDLIEEQILGGFNGKGTARRRGSQGCQQPIDGPLHTGALMQIDLQPRALQQVLEQMKFEAKNLEADLHSRR